MPIFGKEVKTIPNEKPETVGEVYRIPIGQLHPHPENPYGIRDDPDMLELTESVRKFGVLCPAIARPQQGGGYELIAGHRRKEACERAGLDSMPVIVMNLDDNDTIIQLVDSNIQRENILPSERAKAYKLRIQESIKERPSWENDRQTAGCPKSWLAECRGHRPEHRLIQENCPEIWYRLCALQGQGSGSLPCLF